MKKCIYICCFFLMSCCPALVSAELVTFDFEEGAFGTHWTSFSASGQNHDLNFTGTSPALISGSYSLGPVPWGNRDQPHTLFHARSESFQLSSSSDLTVQVKGGSDLSIDPNLGTGSISAGVQGMTLTRVSNNERVLSLGIHTKWELAPTTLTLTQAQLAPFAAESGETWTLDLYDSYDGGYGWYSVDNITFSVVPEPSSLATFGFVLFLGLGSRRKRKSL